MFKLAILPDICDGCGETAAACDCGRIAEDRLHVVADGETKSEAVSTLCGRPVPGATITSDAAAYLPLCRVCWKGAVPVPRSSRPNITPPKPTVPRFVLPATVEQPKSLRGQQCLLDDMVWNGEEWVKYVPADRSEAHTGLPLALNP
jgi:hypothetical protein